MLRLTWRHRPLDVLQLTRGWAMVSEKRWTIPLRREQALAEVTHLWTPSAPSGSDAAAPPLHLLDAEPEVLQSLSARADAAEDQMSRFRDQLASLSGLPFDDWEARLASLEEPKASANSLVVAGGKAHVMLAGTEELPRALWATVCGWRCGRSPAIQILPLRKLASSGSSLCLRCDAKSVSA